MDNTNLNILHKPHITSILLVFGQIADGITTIWFLSLGITEANPFPYNYGWTNFVLLKIAATIVMILLLEFVVPEHKIFTIAKWVIGLCSWIPAIWNIL